jgi:hypothetical protein
MKTSKDPLSNISYGIPSIRDDLSRIENFINESFYEILF